jgi:hypothetical protein
MGVAHDHRQFSPVAAMPFCMKINQFVKEFAEKNDLRFLPFYHDLPVWIVHEPEEGRARIRRLQICEYLVSADAYLSIVPSVHVVVKGKTMAPRHTRTNRFKMNEVLSGRTIDGQKLLRRIQAAWDTTVTLEYGQEELLDIARS